MGVEITFSGGAGTFEHGELGGVQFLVNDIAKSTKFFFDYGQPPDRTNEFYSFPYRTKQYELVDVAANELGLYASMQGLFRHDLEHRAGRKIQELPLDGILLSHAHYDHAGGMTLVRHDMPVYMHPLAQAILYIWQYTGGRTLNQFVDVYQQMTRSPKRHGKEKYVSGEEARLRRDIRLFESEQAFKIGNMDITPYLVDHSLPGSSAFIMDTSEGRMSITGDIRLRGRRREHTERFFEEAKDVDYFFIEGSLLHFDHYGTEEDVTDVLEELIEGRDLIAISYPPRDLDRLLSVYNACKRSGRMLVVPPNQAKLLEQFNGINGYPRLSNKYIGVLMKKKGKGLAEDTEEFEDLIEGDYYKWERPYLKFDRWDPEDLLKGKELKRGDQKKRNPKKTRVFLKDIAENQDKFVLFTSQADMISLFNEIQPAKDSLYIRSHPGPWTKEMEVQEDQLIKILEHFGMYKGPQPDCLADLYLRGRKADLFTRGDPVMHKMHQVHVTGHMNREETREIIRSLDDRTIIIPYHSMRPLDFLEDVAKGRKVFIPERGITYTMEEIRNAE